MFTVKPDDIKHFTGEQLVELLRGLLYAEARKAGVPLRAVDVPLQITIADGGKDAHVLWEDGAASTDFSQAATSSSSARRAIMAMRNGRRRSGPSRPRRRRSRPRS